MDFLKKPTVKTILNGLKELKKREVKVAEPSQRQEVRNKKEIQK